MNKSLPASFGEMLQQLRRQKKLPQKVLAERLGVHRNTIGAWERGDRLPDTKGMVLELARQLNLNHEETRLLLEASLTGLSSYWSIPHQRNPFFTGRATIIQRLYQYCHDQTHAVSGVYALSGLGGSGKTQLMVEYAYRYAHNYAAVFWVAAETHTTILASLSKITKLLQLPEQQEPQRLIETVQNWFSTHKEWLLIFDNVEDIATLKPYLMATRQGTILITTRLHTLHGLAPILEMPPFEREEGCHFLLLRAGLLNTVSHPNELPTQTVDAAQMLVTTMDGLPLALDQAGAYIEKTGCSIKDYLQLFQIHQMHLLTERPVDADHPASVVKTFQHSFEQLQQASPTAIQLLYACAFLAPEGIPLKLLLHGAMHFGSPLDILANNMYALNQVLGDALHYSLIQRQSHTNTFLLPHLVQLALRANLSQQEQGMWIERMALALDALFPLPQHNTGITAERLLPHVFALLNHAGSWQERSPALVSLSAKTDRYVSQQINHSTHL